MTQVQVRYFWIAARKFRSNETLDEFCLLIVRVIRLRVNVRVVKTCDFFRLLAMSMILTKETRISPKCDAHSRIKARTRNRGTLRGTYLLSG